MNASLQHIRRTWTKPTVSWDQVDDEFKAELFSEFLTDAQPTPEERLQRLEHREMLEDALHKLPLDMRRAIELCKSADYTMKEAASALGLPVTRLKARLHRGKRALRIHLKTETQPRRKRSANKRRLQLCPACKESLRAA